MNVLSCNVRDCHYNRKDTCRKDLIMVDHSFSDATKCRSFQVKTKSDYTAETAHEFVDLSKTNTQINCKVENCAYNHHYDCYAQFIDIVEQARGDSRCETFKE